MNAIHPFPRHALCLALSALSLPLSAADSADTAKDDTPGVVVINAQSARGLRAQTVKAGTFRGSDVMDVPSTVNVVTREALDQQAASGLYDAVRNTAGVTRQQNGGETWDQLVIRGMTVENRTNYRLNGSLSVMNFSQVMIEDKERVEVLKGASALYYGFTSPAGIVNFVTKQPLATPLTSVAMTLDQHGTAILSTDLSRRFGEQEQLGLRFNAGGGSLGSYLDGVDAGSRRFAALAMDWKASSRLRIRSDFEYDYRDTTEQVGVALPSAVKGVITLPHPVDPRKMVGPDSASFTTETLNGLVRADYALADNWALNFEAGHAQTARDRNLAIFRFTNAAAVATGAGKIQGNSQHLLVDADLLKAELYGAFDTLTLRHELSLGLSKTDKSQDPIYQRTYTVAAQNLYAPLPITSLSWGALPSAPTTEGLDSTDTGVYLLDRIALNPRWQIIAGLRHSSLRSDQGDKHYAVDETTPMLSGVFKPTEALSFYASYARGVEEGDTAPTGAANVGERLPPGISKQYELGSRWLTKEGTLVSAALFEIDRPGSYTNAESVFIGDGEQRYRGIEISTQGQLTRQLSWLSAAQWLDPRLRHTAAEYEGKLPENAARRTASAFLCYELTSIPGLSVNGGAYYTGRRPVNDLDQAWLDPVTLFTAGARYATRIHARAVSWQMNVENLTDKQYWAGAGTRLAAGAPRTFKFGVKVEL